MKLCRGCGRTLDESEFTKNKRSPDGLDWRCRNCKREHSRKYIYSEKGIETRQKYYEQHKSDHMEYKKTKRNIYAEQNPEKVRARWLLGNAVRKGYIPKPENSRTWHNHWEFHHPDHSRPFYGVWLTPSEHRLMELGQIPCPECVDYTEIVRQRVLADWGLF